MKQLLILSGKGGTGKTTIASAFIQLTNAKAYADCDIDAPNLHLVTKQSVKPNVTNYYGMPKSNIDTSVCISCDKCRQYCRFDAIKLNQHYSVDSFACEGCGVCRAVCPARAISLLSAIAGEIKLYNEETIFSTAQLKMGSGTSGKLVTEVKKQLKSIPSNADIAIIDGSPGIGCPVIASLSGVDMVLIVAEPTLSGINDLQRIVSTAKIFNTLVAVCVNKYDINLTGTEKIIEFCTQQQIEFVGKIPFDSMAVKAINKGKTIVDIDCLSGKAVTEVFTNTISKLYQSVKQ